MFSVTYISTEPWTQPLFLTTGLVASGTSVFPDVQTLLVEVLVCYLCCLYHCVSQCYYCSSIDSMWIHFKAGFIIITVMVTINFSCLLCLKHWKNNSWNNCSLLVIPSLFSVLLVFNSHWSLQYTKHTFHFCFSPSLSLIMYWLGNPRRLLAASAQLLHCVWVVNFIHTVNCFNFWVF
jgi:hypothetical protein